MMYIGSYKKYLSSVEIKTRNVISRDEFLECLDAVRHKFLVTHESARLIQMYKEKAANDDLFKNAMCVLYDKCFGERWFTDYLRIIYILHQDINIPMNQVAEYVGINPSTARKRILSANSRLELCVENGDIGPLTTIELFCKTSLPPQVGHALIRYIPRSERSKNMYHFVETYHIEEIKKIRGIGLAALRRIEDALDAIGLKLTKNEKIEVGEATENSIRIIMEQCATLRSLGTVNKYRVDKIYDMAKSLLE